MYVATGNNWRVLHFTLMPLLTNHLLPCLSDVSSCFFLLASSLSSLLWLMGHRSLFLEWKCRGRSYLHSLSWLRFCVWTHWSLLTSLWPDGGKHSEVELCWEMPLGASSPCEIPSQIILLMSSVSKSLAASSSVKVSTGAWSTGFGKSTLIPWEAAAVTSRSHNGCLIIKWCLYCIPNNRMTVAPDENVASCGKILPGFNHLQIHFLQLSIPLCWNFGPNCKSAMDAL